MSLEVAQALQLRGLLRREDIPAVAVDLLEAGRDTPTIRRLAGLSRDDLYYAVELFSRVLEELEREEPALDDAASALARHLAEAALAPEADLRALAADGARLAVAFDYPDVLMEFYSINDCYNLPELFATAGVDERLIDYARKLVKLPE
jgi:hypothetical protein